MERAVLGDDELRVLEFLAEHRVAITWHVQELLGCSSQAAEARVRRLAQNGLVRRQKIFDGHPAACWITRRGLGAIGSNLPAPQLNLQEYRHDVGVGWLWLAAHRGEFGPVRRVVSERAMRSADRRDGALGPRYGVGAGAGGRVHYPDLLLETAGPHRVALELELTGKGRRRLDGIMLGYAADPRIDAVLYLCPRRGPVAQGIQQAVRRSAIGDRVTVQLLAPGSPEGAPPARGSVSHERQFGRVRFRRPPASKSPERSAEL